ncbi:MAG TPA: NAD(P)-binding domain-containing protein [Chloroflexota bacterium]|nr:NAD(P)-binding domain-containing protein [Chloroflexota bacterium]
MFSLIGIAGLNARGRAIGARLRTAGLRLVGYDPDVQAAATSGLRTVSSLERLTQEADMILIAQDGDEAAALTQDVLGLQSIRAVVCCGTQQPDRARELAASAGDRGVSFVEIAFDDDDSVQLGRAVVFAGGKEVDVETCRPVLEACGMVILVGDAGAAQVARAVSDLLRWSNVLAVKEAFGLAETHGCDVTAVRRAMLAGSGGSRALEDWGKASLPEGRQAVERALALAQGAGAEIPFLSRMDELLAALDGEKLNGLFNLGIVDLSQHEGDEPPPETAEAELEAPIEGVATVEDEPAEA